MVCRLAWASAGWAFLIFAVAAWPARRPPAVALASDEAISTNARAEATIVTDAVAKLDALSVTPDRAQFSFVSSLRTIVILLLVLCAVMRLHDTPDDGHTMLEAVADAAAWTIFGSASALQGLRPRSSVSAMITCFLLGQTALVVIYLREANLRGSVGGLAAVALLVAPIAFILDILAPQPSGPSMVPLPLHHGSSKLSQWLFLYCDRFVLSFARAHPPEDMPGLSRNERAAVALADWRRTEASMPKLFGREPSLTRRFVWHFRRQLLQQELWLVVNVLGQFSVPLLLKLLLDAIASAQPTHVAYSLAGLSLLGTIIEAVANQRAQLIARGMAQRTTSIASALVVLSTLSASSSAVGQDLGRASNLISSDAERMARVAFRIYLLSYAPLLFLVSVSWLFYILGPAALFAALVIVASLPAHSGLGRWGRRYQRQVMRQADKRLRATSEAIVCARAVKANGWTDPLIRRLAVFRKAETDALVRRMLVVACQASLGVVTPAFASLAAFAARSFTFAALSTIAIIREPMTLLGKSLSELAAGAVAAHRLEGFLADQSETRKWEILDRSSGRVGFGGDAKFTFDVADPDSFRLGPLELNFPIGKLSLGAGKSALLSALLGELPAVDPCRVSLPAVLHRAAKTDPSDAPLDGVAFCAQTPFLESKSLRSNILMGAKMDLERYKSVVAACCLEVDIGQLSMGDETLVGERGTVLSGGQRARVALARALYSSASVLLLDDVLSAVDAATARHLVDTLRGPLTRDRTIILVTHAVRLCLPIADGLIVGLEEGSVIFAGSATDASAALSVETLDLMQIASPSLAAVDLPEESSAPVEFEDEAPLPASPTDDKSTQPFGLINKDQRAVYRALRRETRRQGSVSSAVFLRYARAIGSVWAWLGIVGLLLAYQLLELAERWTLKRWTSTIDHEVSGLGGLGLYAAVITLGAIAMVVRTSWILRAGVAASTRLYDQLIESTMHAPILFFDVTPVGRLLNRIGKDFGQVDENVSPALSSLMTVTFQLLGIVIVLQTVLPVLIAPLGLILLSFLVLGYGFKRAALELRRRESVSKSPIFVAVGEAARGAVTIRAYGDTARYVERLFRHLDRNLIAASHAKLLMRWLALRCLAIGSLASLATAIAVIHQGLDSAQAGFVLSFAAVFASRVQWSVRMFTSFELEMASVERISEYIDLEQEPSDGVPPPAAWPSAGSAVDVAHLSLRYAPGLPLALDDVSFHVAPGTRCGIVGRSGSGKSSTALSLLRMVEAELGTIEIDGLDIGSIRLGDLRNRVTFIAQETALFGASVRFNLDPLGEHDDAELNAMLRLVGLTRSTAAPTPIASRRPSCEDLSSSLAVANAPIIRLPISLDLDLGANGSILSVGERQLLGLARGLLKLRARSCSLLITDEASSSVDDATDARIQRLIRDETEGCTVISIAHRLQTVARYDQVLVMGAGRVVEMGRPADLLARSDSAFRALAVQSGELAAITRLAGGL